MSKVFKMSFSSIYPMYIQKVEKKDEARKNLIRLFIGWQAMMNKDYRNRSIAGWYGNLFAEVPQLNENVGLIKGVICGYRVEEIEDPLMQKIRYLDKLVDELAKGKDGENLT